MSAVCPFAPGARVKHACDHPLGCPTLHPFFNINLHLRIHINIAKSKCNFGGKTPLPFPSPTANVCPGGYTRDGYNRPKTMLLVPWPSFPQTARELDPPLSARFDRPVPVQQRELHNDELRRLINLRTSLTSFLPRMITGHR